MAPMLAQLYPMIICTTGVGAERGFDQEDCIASISSASAAV
jgi:hypothetical protein